MLTPLPLNPPVESTEGAFRERVGWDRHSQLQSAEVLSLSPSSTRAPLVLLIVFTLTSTAATLTEGRVTSYAEGGVYDDCALSVSNSPNASFDGKNVNPINAPNLYRGFAVPGAGQEISTGPISPVEEEEELLDDDSAPLEELLDDDDSLAELLDDDDDDDDDPLEELLDNPIEELLEEDPVEDESAASRD